MKIIREIYGFDSEILKILSVLNKLYCDYFDGLVIL